MIFSELTDFFQKSNVLLSETSTVRKQSTVAAKLMENPSDADLPDVAIIGFPYDIQGVANRGSAKAPDAVRRELYGLRHDFGSIKVADLGDIHPGLSLSNAHQALRDVVQTLKNLNIVSVIIGGSHDLTAEVCKALSVDSKLTLSIVDGFADVCNPGDVDHLSFLTSLLTNNRLAAFNLIGWQNYQTEIEPLTQLDGFPYFALRLGEIRMNRELAEPLFRDSQVISFDMAAVRFSDSPGCLTSGPNGLYGEEFCQMARFAGFSDKLWSFNLCEMNPEADMRGLSAKLGAQTLWHLLEGLANRYGDHPKRPWLSYQKFVVHQTDTDSDIVFYHNSDNNRWWMDVSQNDERRIVACIPDDYKEACNSVLPDRYIRWMAF